MKRLVLGLIVLASVSSFANEDDCVSYSSTSPEASSIYDSFDNFCSSISPLRAEYVESDRIKRIAKIDEFQNLRNQVAKLTKDNAGEMLLRLEGVEDQFEQSIRQRRELLKSLEAQIKALRNEVANLEAAQSLIIFLDQYINNKLCDDKYTEGSRRGGEVCQNGEWVHSRD